MNAPKALPEMSIDRLRQVLDSYGARPEMWPSSEREAALALVLSTPEAKALLEEAEALDRMLDAAPQIEPSAALRARILDGIPKAPVSLLDRLDQLAARLWPFGPRWRPAAALAGAAALGIAVGAWMPYESHNNSTADSTAAPDVSEMVFAGYGYSGDEP